MKLRLREEHLPSITSRWHEHKPAVLDTVIRLFQTGDTSVNLERKLSLSTTTNRPDYQENMVIATHRRPSARFRTTAAMMPKPFGCTIPRIDELHAVSDQVWYNGHQRQIG